MICLSTLDSVSKSKSNFCLSSLPTTISQFAKDRSLHGGEEGENKANLTLLQMAMDDDSDTEADPLGANCQDVGPNLGPNPMLSEQKGCPVNCS